MKERFITFWTLEYGFRLAPENNVDADIVPVFVGPGTEETFRASLSQDYLARNVGKKIFCDCVGKRRVEDGAIMFDVYEARIFAQ